MNTLIGIPKINKSCSKKELCDWFRNNWKLISPTLGTVENNKQIESSDVEDLFFIDNNSDI